ncbi:cysteine hydrolase [Candidatus Woesearchaeota archaeon]|nr:cysteine hydrolase [Candidatus Woesearchaeota archaeon]
MRKAGKMRIFYDIDTQHDFMSKFGALYIPDAELIKPNLKKLTEHAKAHGIPVIGSVDRHFGTEEYKDREGELQRWGGPFPDHCMAKTGGETKIGETLLYTIGSGKPADSAMTDRYGDRSIYIPHLSESMDVWGQTEWAFKVEWFSIRFQKTEEEGHIFIPTYFEKQAYDIFTNPALGHVLHIEKPKEAIVYGVATDYCVKAAVLGIQQRGIQCYVVEDAIKGVDPKTTEAAIEEMKKAGAKFINTKKVLEEIVR